eukprot:g422.t1
MRMLAFSLFVLGVTSCLSISLDGFINSALESVQGGLGISGNGKKEIEHKSFDDCFLSEGDALLQLQKGEWQDYWSSFINEALNRGYYDLSKALIKHTKANNRIEKDINNRKAMEAIKRQVVSTTGKIRRELQTVANLVRTLAQPSSKISPAFEWAESNEFIYLNVKFAHKLDTPATLGVKKQKLTFTETSLYFEAFAERTGKQFILDLTLFGQILPEVTSFSMSSVGRCTITMRKRIAIPWEGNLLAKPDSTLKASNSRPRNMHVWWSMQEKYNDELEKRRNALKTQENTTVANFTLSESQIKALVQHSKALEAQENEKKRKHSRSHHQSNIVPRALPPSTSEIEKLEKEHRKSLRLLANKFRADIATLQMKFESSRKTLLETDESGQGTTDTEL